jgi:hypothetical protein
MVLPVSHLAQSLTMEINGTCSSETSDDLIFLKIELFNTILAFSRTQNRGAELGSFMIS